MNAGASDPPLVGTLAEEEHPALLRALPAVLFAVTDNERGLVVPSGLTDLVGVPPGASRPATIGELVDPPHLAAALALLAQELPPVAPRATRLRLLGDDEPIEVLATCRRARNGSTDMPLLAFVPAPLAEEDDEELRHREHLLAEAERVAHLGSWSWDIAADSVEWSDQLYRMYGYEPGEIEVTLATVIEHTVPELRDHTRSMIEEGLRTQLPFTYSHRIRQANGAIRTLQSRGRVAEVDDAGHPLYMIGVCQDVTTELDLREQGRQFQELYERERQVASRLREVDELKDALVAAVSHDLRTPLAVIVGSATTLRDLGPQLDRETSRSLLDNTIEHANRLHAMLSDLLDLDRLRRGIMSPKLRPTALQELIRHALGAGGYDTSRVELEEREHDVIAEVDAPKVERIVENLVRNALRHTPADSTVWVRVEEEDGTATITVEDNGPGVPVEARERVFEPFERGAGTALDTGSGLGLAIVHRFVRLHDGIAWVDDRPGGGAAFHVRLPLRQR